MADHARDTQAEAFRNAGPEDWMTDDDLEAALGDGTLLVATSEEFRTVEEHEADGWDSERVGTKDLDAAKAALADRVDDPSAPDDDPEAYDELDGSEFGGSD
jgi:hypothetical protein